MSTFEIGTTSKGNRVWLQGLNRYGWHAGDTYQLHKDMDYGTLTLERHPLGKKKVAKGKGGIVDMVGKWVTDWAQDSTEVTVMFTATHITIRRVK